MEKLVKSKIMWSLFAEKRYHLFADFLTMTSKLQ